MIFKVGDVWEWCGQSYLLLERVFQEHMTVYNDNEEKWKTFMLEEGRVIVARLHTSERGGIKWTKLS